MRRVFILIGLLLAASPASAKPSPNIVVAPTPAELGVAFHRIRMRGRVGTVMAGLAVPVTLVGLGFANSDTPVAVSTGRVMMVTGIAAAVVGVPVMAQAGKRGANTLRWADPRIDTPLLNGAWGFHAVAIGFGVAAAATRANREGDTPWLFRRPGLATVSGVSAVVGFTIALAQLRKNVDHQSVLASTGAVEPYRGPQARVVPTLGPDHVGIVWAGSL